MKNGVKNGRKTRFSRERQPSREAKSQGWARRKLAQEFMNKVMMYQDLTITQFEKLGIKIEKHKSKFTIQELMAFRYVTQAYKSDKFLLDWLDRHVGKAPNLEKDSIDTEDTVIVRIIEGQDYDED